MDPSTYRTRATRTAVGKAGAKDLNSHSKVSCMQRDTAREVQKRTRNRLAQKAVRERRTAHVRHLEQQLAACQRSDAERFQEVLNENAKLRDGLYTARKKLLSVATTVTKIANDIGPLLHLDTSTSDSELMPPTQDLGPSHSRSPSHVHPTVTTGRPSVHATEVEGNVVDIHRAGHELTNALGDEELSYNQPSTPVWIDPSTDGSACESVYNASGLLKSSQSQPPAFVGTSYIEGVSNVISENENDTADSFPTFSEPSWLNIDSLPHPINSTQVLSRRYPHSLFSDHLDFIQKLLQQNGYAEKHFCSPPKVVELMLREFLEQCWPAMGPWFAITNAYEIVKSICWWRLTKTSQALDAIQKSYKPTAIQQTLQYPSIIDWIPYPEIRDRLILNLEAYDIDQIICDMAEAYVVERVSLSGHPPQPCNLLDLVQFSVQASMNSSICHPSSTSSISHDAWSKRSVVDRAITIFSSQLPRPFRIPGFKIHSSFFERYPTLYDPSAVAENAMNIPASTIRLQRALPLNQRATDNYIKVLVRGTCAVAIEGIHGRYV